MENYILIVTLILILYYVMRPISIKEKKIFGNKDNWRGGF